MSKFHSEAHPSSVADRSVLALLALLMWVALLNGYPLLFFDSGQYLNTAVSRLYAPMDRPVIYGWFLFLTTLNLTPWLAVAAQAALVLAVVDLTRRAFFRDLPPHATAIAVAVLAGLSTVPFFVAQIMPDVFTGLVPLTVSLLVFRFEQLSLWARVGLGVLLFFAIGSHNSHQPGVVACLIVALAWQWLMPRQYATGQKTRPGLAGALVVVASVCAAVLALMASNLATFGRLTISPGSHVFLMGRLLADGPAVTYLRRHCPQSGLKLCDYVDEIPTDANEFIWHAPILKNVGNWGGSRPEFQIIISGTLREEWIDVTRNALVAGVRQFLHPGIADALEPIGGEFALHEAMGRLYPQDTHEFAASLQQQGRLESPPFTGLALMQKAAYWVTFGVLVHSGFTAWRRHRVLVGALLVALVFLVTNAFICGALSGVHERYQGRASWIVPLLATFWLLHRMHMRTTARHTAKVSAP